MEDSSNNWNKLLYNLYITFLSRYSKNQSQLTIETHLHTQGYHSLIHSGQFIKSVYLPTSGWMVKEMSLLSHEEWNHVFCRKLDGARHHHVNWIK